MVAQGERAERVEGVGADPEVKDAAVVGLPHDPWGEAVHAVVVRQH